MYNLRHWPTRKVGDLFHVNGRIGWRGLKRRDFCSDGPYLITGMHIDDNGSVDWRSCFHIPLRKYEESPEIKVAPRDLVITKDGTIGKVAYIDYLPGPTSLNSHLFLVRIKDDIDICPRFAFHIFRSQIFQEFIEQQKSGSTLSGLGEMKFIKFQFPLPQKSEQNTFVRLLDTLDTTIRQTEAIIAKLQQVKQGLLHDLLTRGIDANGQLRPPVEQAPHLYKESPLGWIPMEWEVGPLSYCVASLDAGVSVNAEDRPHGSSEIGVLKTSAISNGVFYPEQNKAVVAREIRLVREPVQADSILVSRMNTPLLVGESCYVDVDSPNLFLPDRIWQLKIRESSIVQTKWLSYIFRTSHYRAYVEIHATGTSGSMKNLPKSRLLDMPVAFPKFREQVQTSNRMTVIDQRINAERANLRKLINEKSALMDDLLTGRMRVTALLSGETRASTEPERKSA
ncbi:MAG: restriction endonuclease subunit S [Candidatus Competibacter sp.]|nr:restriction endonuclease subunit S [Candidatus Competibacter sp.]